MEHRLEASENEKEVLLAFFLIWLRRRRKKKAESNSVRQDGRTLNRNENASRCLSGEAAKEKKKVSI